MKTISNTFIWALFVVLLFFSRGLVAAEDRWEYTSDKDSASEHSWVSADGQSVTGSWVPVDQFRSFAVSLNNDNESVRGDGDRRDEASELQIEALRLGSSAENIDSKANTGLMEREESLDAKSALSTSIRSHRLFSFDRPKNLPPEQNSEEELKEAIRKATTLNIEMMSLLNRTIQSPCSVEVAREEVPCTNRSTTPALLALPVSPKKSFAKAWITQDLAAVKQLLKTGELDVNTPDENGETPLQYLFSNTQILLQAWDRRQDTPCSIIFTIIFKRSNEEVKNNVLLFIRNHLRTDFRLSLPTWMKVCSVLRLDWPLLENMKRDEVLVREMLEWQEDPFNPNSFLGRDVLKLAALCGCKQIYHHLVTIRGNHSNSGYFLTWASVSRRGADFIAYVLEHICPESEGRIYAITVFKCAAGAPGNRKALRALKKWLVYWPLEEQQKVFANALTNNNFDTIRFFVEDLHWDVAKIVGSSQLTPLILATLKNPRREVIEYLIFHGASESWEALWEGKTAIDRVQLQNKDLAQSMREWKIRYEELGTTQTFDHE